MPLNRRGFLKMVGLGGAGIAAASVIPGAAKAVVKPIIAPLFGSDEVLAPSGIIGASTDLGVHEVVFARSVFDPLTPEKRAALKAEYVARAQDRRLWPAEKRTGRILAGETSDNHLVVGKVRSPTPSKKVGRGGWERQWVHEWETVQEFCIVPPGMPDAIEGVDPHALYYQAALKMRERFRQHTLNRLLQLSEWQRNHVRLVTVVHQPIYARPYGMMSGGDGARNPFNTEGFEVACEFQTLLYRNNDFDTQDNLPDLSEFKRYSGTGEYPIDPPNDIEMGILMKLDRQVLSQEILAKPANTRRGFFKLWTP
jgi:hypothetical protein